VHILHDFLARKSEGRFRLSRSIGRGVLIKALTTTIGFGTLMISNQPGLSGLGFCLTLGIVCSMISALIFLPSALQRWHAREQVLAEDSTPEHYRLAA
jgi:predicted RND superfamily exporter protein